MLCMVCPQGTISKLSLVEIPQLDAAAEALAVPSRYVRLRYTVIGKL